MFLRAVPDKDERKLGIGQTGPADGSALSTRLQRIIIENSRRRHEDYRMASIVLRPALVENHI